MHGDSESQFKIESISLRSRKEVLAVTIRHYPNNSVPENRFYERENFTKEALKPFSSVISSKNFSILLSFSRGFSLVPVDQSKFKKTKSVSLSHKSR